MLSTLAVIALNIVAATGRLNGVTPAEISAKYPTVITPAGWAFSIWSSIYLGLLAFSIFQMLPSRIASFSELRVPYLVSCLLNAVWILLWHKFYIGLDAVVLLALVIVLLSISAKLRRSDSFVGAILSKGVFGLYAGWVTVASLVNLVVYIVSTGLQMSVTDWDLIGIPVLAIAIAASIFVRIRLRNFVYPLPIAWAAAGIGANQSGNTPIVVAAAITCIGCLIISGTVVTELKSSTT